MNLPETTCERQRGVISRVNENSMFVGSRCALHATAWALDGGFAGDATPSGVLVMLHGLGDHGRRFRRIAESVCVRGWVVVAMDLPGHGQSPGKRGCYVRYADLMRHISALRSQLSERFGNVGHVLFGHSMGGNLALNYAIRRQEFDCQRCAPLSGLNLCAPFLLPPKLPRRDQVLAAWVTGHLIPWFRLNRPVDRSELTQDSAHARQMAADPNLHSRVSLGLATELLAQGRFALDHAHQINIPTRIDCGGADRLISRSACRHATMRIGENADYRLWQGQRHDLLHDTGADKVIASMTKWVTEVVSGRDRERRRAA